MAEELQGLIDRIQQEGVAKAQAEAESLVAQAEERAAQIVKAAEEQAAAKLQAAKEGAEQFTERSRKTLEQAARNLLILIGQGVENILGEIAGKEVDAALNVTVVEKMLLKLLDSFATHETDGKQIDLLLSPEDHAELSKFFAERYREKMVEGVELRTDSDVVKGFKVSLVDDQVYHDFTAPAIAEALMNLLRPDLAEIVYRAARNQEEK